MCPAGALSPEAVHAQENEAGRNCPAEQDQPEPFPVEQAAYAEQEESAPDAHIPPPKQVAPPSLKNRTGIIPSHGTMLGRRSCAFPPSLTLFPSGHPRS